MPPANKAALTTYVETTPIQIVSDDQVFQKATDTNLSDPVSTEIAAIYQTGRTNAFQITMLTVAFFCLVGLIMSGGLPKKSMAELASVEG